MQSSQYGHLLHGREIKNLVGLLLDIVIMPINCVLVSSKEDPIKQDKQVFVINKSHTATFHILTLFSSGTNIPVVLSCSFASFIFQEN